MADFRWVPSKVAKVAAIVEAELITEAETPVADRFAAVISFKEGFDGLLPPAPREEGIDMDNKRALTWALPSSRSL
jgi:hypothetical protein